MHKRGKTDSGGCTKSGKAGTIMTHRVRETCFCGICVGSDTVQIDFLTITEENVEKIKCRSDTDHREETQL